MYSGHTGQQVIVVGGDSIGHCRKKISYRHVSISDWSPSYCCLNLQIKKYYEL